MPRRKKSRKSLPNPNPSTMLQDAQEETISIQPVGEIEVDGEDEDRPMIEAPEASLEEIPPSSPVSDAVVVPDVPLPNPPPTSRKPNAGGKRKKPFHCGKKRLAEIEEKLELLRGNFRPIPFSPPAKVPDFAKHERLFRALGLWDFAHLDLDREIRSDLLILLIAGYDPPNRRSFVGKMRVSVSRADLARALGLPVKKDKAELDPEVVSGEEPAAVVLDFISSWMLFQDEDNPAWILPKEVVAATQMVKEGQPHKVDWAGLMWILVEKEMLEAPKSGKCFYASHLQCLMKHQKRSLFEEAELEPEPDMEVEVDMEPEQEQEPSLEAVALEGGDDDDVGDGGIMKTRSLDEFQDNGAEGQGPGLSLGLGATGGDGMDGVESCKEEQEEQEVQEEQWIDKEKSSGLEHCLQPCSMSVERNIECENLIKDGSDGLLREEDRYDNELTEKFSSLERYASTDLLQSMDTVNISYSPPRHHLDQSSGDFLAMRSDSDKNMAMAHDPSSSLLFGNGCKRGIADIADGGVDEEDSLQEFPQGNQRKRMCSVDPWEHTQSPYDACMEQVQCWMGKAKMLHAEKEQGYKSAQLELQYLNAVLQQKDQIIQSLEKTRMEEQQKRHLEFCRFEHELKLMAHLLVGYKKALREIRAAFADFRKQVSGDDESLYKDVPGSGGLVLSSRELDRQRHEKEEEMRHLAVGMINDFQKEWFAKFDEFADWVVKSASKLVHLADEVKLLKERFEESKGLSN
ncbi:uncharacterized protein LOC120256345 [Dioscorea cayenensis subsp. rotundata]|uniref:Uncharacterized protein LOC120256345 n=1 Tax=Dioscorea cayennensis subsp. rotundata TaxID=55577 RepID=A0AB40AYB1_DIOCR|nr:uncharacterized protein LOC120256345 [Dioscorea cayenensis subsp. rotundata]